jgi:hypothetical protein
MIQRLEIPVIEMSDEFLDSNIPRINQFCVSLLHNSSLIGSGTLVQCGNKYGILTAHHVVYKGNRPFDFRYASDDAIQLVIQASPHEFVLPLKFIVCHDIGVPVSDEQGPDLVFLEIPPGDKLGALKARKSFFNLTANPDDRLAFCKAKEGLWVMSYSIAEQSSMIKLEDGAPAISVRAWIGYTSPDRWFQIGEFDYVEVGVTYNPENHLPASFGGASGGALWKLRFRDTGSRRNNGKIDIEADKLVLAGVLFYQTRQEKNYWQIRCHGPESIYHILPKRVVGPTI